MTLRYPPVEASARLSFGSNSLDRMSERRDDELLMHAVRRDAAARALLFAGDRLVVWDGGPLLARREAEAAGVDWAETIYLGLGEDGPLFGAAIDERDDLDMRTLRTLAIEGELAPQTLAAAAQASALLAWHRTHKFCSRCGQPSRMTHAGYRRDCPSCGAQHFPRTDPVVIMLAIDGERCLLGHQKRFTSGFYSCLAGFMEPGETIEAAVRREIWEETGVKAGRVLYHASQPWPFPANLMIGCFAEAISTEIEPRDNELDDVRWFTRADLVQMLAGTHPTHSTPPAISIAHHLLRTYAEHGAPVGAGAEV